MSRVKILPSVLRGRLEVPVSKSAAHRALICSALAGGGDPLPPGAELSDDLLATRNAVRALLSPHTGPAALDCGESGSTLRFLIPVAAALGRPAVFTGRGRLPRRPLGVYADCLPPHGVSLEGGGQPDGLRPGDGPRLPLTVSGRLAPGLFRLPGGVSSQFVTGLLFALPLLPGESEIVLTSPLESAPYAEMTARALRAFGVSVQQTPSGWRVPGGQRYRPAPGYRIERDWSQAAFFLAAGTLGGPVELEGLDPDSAQGDRAAEGLFRRLGARVEWSGGLLRAQAGGPRALPPPAGTEIDASQIPDLVPALAAAAALLPGRRTRIVRAERLRLKESDRLAAMAEGLNRLGGRVRERPDGLEICGVPALSGGTARGYGDHRVVMALAVAALRSRGAAVLTDARSVRKSYPGFFRDYNRLGGKADVLGD